MKLEQRQEAAALELEDTSGLQISKVVNFFLVDNC